MEDTSGVQASRLKGIIDSGCIVFLLRFSFVAAGGSAHKAARRDALRFTGEQLPLSSPLCQLEEAHQADAPTSAVTRLIYFSFVHITGRRQRISRPCNYKKADPLDASAGTNTQYIRPLARSLLPPIRSLLAIKKLKVRPRGGSWSGLCART